MKDEKNTIFDEDENSGVDTAENGHPDRSTHASAPPLSKQPCVYRCICSQCNMGSMARYSMFPKMFSDSAPFLREPTLNHSSNLSKQGPEMMPGRSKWSVVQNLGFEEGLQSPPLQRGKELLRKFSKGSVSAASAPIFASAHACLFLQVHTQ